MPSTPRLRSGVAIPVVSYLFDWVIIVIFLGISGAFQFLQPIKRDFSLTDRTISFPYRKDTISISALFLIAVVAPAVIITLICLVFVRFPAGLESDRRHGLWKRKLWETHATLLGLAMSITLSLFLTQSMKNMFGKPRPDFLARCNPDVNNAVKYFVGGYTSETLEGTSELVSWEICQNKDGAGVGKSEFTDGFRSFPSGHCTVAFAGLAYLSLFLAAKFSAVIPILATPEVTRRGQRSARNRVAGAAPPLYLLVIALIPVCAAVYIASTRFTDYKHAGFDVLFASVEGALAAWFAFRWYHLPIRRGAGWAWGPRHRDAAFGVGTGVGSYGLHNFAKKGGQGRGPNGERNDLQSRSMDLELHDLESAGGATTTGGSYESQQRLT